MCPFCKVRHPFPEPCGKIAQPLQQVIRIRDISQGILSSLDNHCTECSFGVARHLYDIVWVTDFAERGILQWESRGKGSFLQGTSFGMCCSTQPCVHAKVVLFQIANLFINWRRVFPLLGHALGIGCTKPPNRDYCMNGFNSVTFRIRATPVVSTLTRACSRMPFWSHPIEILTKKTWQ